MTPVEALAEVLLLYWQDAIEDADQVLAELATRGFWLAPVEADEGMVNAALISSMQAPGKLFEWMRDDYLGRGK